MEEDTKAKIVEWLKENRPEYFRAPLYGYFAIIGIVKHFQSGSVIHEYRESIGFCPWSNIVLDKTQQVGDDNSRTANIIRTAKYYGFSGVIVLEKGDIVALNISDMRTIPFVDVFNKKGELKGSFLRKNLKEEDNLRLHPPSYWL